MAHPKRKHSTQRTRKRRANWVTRIPNMGACPQCKKPIIPHRVCPFCGFYRGRQIVEIKPKEEKQKRS